MVTLYLALLLAGVACFLLHFYSQWRVASLMRTKHAPLWKIIAEREGIKLSPLRVWMNLQAALRSPALPALEDEAITRWLRAWRYALWLAWLCWFAAIGLRFVAH